LPRRAEPLRRAAQRAGVAAGIAAIVLAGNGAALAVGPRTHQIVIQGLQYVPETLKVKRGDVVVWVNKDPFPHTVTAAGAFDSKSIAADKSWRFTASRAGTFAYICTLHSNMKATLQVE
jgi:plastocyanin